MMNFSITGLEDPRQCPGIRCPCGVHLARISAPNPFHKKQGEGLNNPSYSKNFGETISSDFEPEM